MTNDRGCLLSNAAFTTTFATTATVPRGLICGVLDLWVLNLLGSDPGLETCANDEECIGVSETFANFRAVRGGETAVSVHFGSCRCFAHTTVYAFKKIE
jgi:hypothetical protein